MHVFMTGATGYIGAAVAQELRRAGHSVTALVRSEESAAAARDAGLEPLQGDIRTPDAWAGEAAAADAVLHAANTGDADADVVDTNLTRALLAGLAGTDRPFLYTSGVWVLGDTDGQEVDEDASTEEPAEKSAWRRELEGEVVAAADRGPRTVVIRPGIVFGQGGGIPGMMGAGQIPLVRGGQHWPMVHVEDLALFYRLALEKAPAGSILHAVSFTATADDVYRDATGEEPEAVPVEEARASLGAFGDALALDQHVSGERSADLLGWHPEHTRLDG